MRNALLWICSLFLLALILELASFAALHMLPSNTARLDRIMARATAQNLEQRVRQKADPVMGWTNHPGEVVAPDCHGRPVTYRYGSHGERLNGSAADASTAKIIAIGDSFTHGLEVADNQTYPARLEAMLGLPVANMGVSGYDMLQPVLRLEQVIGHFPNAKYVVFGFIDDDLFRTVNSYRSLYGDSWRMRNNGFSFKPYIRHGVVTPLDYAAYSDITAAHQAIRKAWENDYWAMPEASFPYSYALLRKLGSHPALLRIYTHLGKWLYNEPYYIAFDMPEIMESYAAALDRFLVVADQHKLVPVLAYLPSEGHSPRSARFFEAFIAQRYGQRLHFIDATSYVDFGDYYERGCHPTAKGQEALARAIAAGLKQTAGEFGGIK